MLSWVDGRPATDLPLGDRGLAYGDGLFETLRVTGERAPLLDWHLRRLADGCARLRIPLDLALIEDELRRFCAALGTGVAKLILTRGEGRRGYAPPAPCQPRRILQAAPLPAYPELNAQAGVELYPCQTRLAEQPLLAGLKHLNRLEQVLARAEWQDARYAEGLLCDSAGRVIEGVFSNLLLVRDGGLLAPALERCGVAGVMRAVLLEAAAAEGIPVRVGDVAREELEAADELLLCNSLYGVWPVVRLAGHDWPVGPLTRKLQDIARSRLEIET